jgi:hypothetical protein
MEAATATSPQCQHLHRTEVDGKVGRQVGDDCKQIFDDGVPAEKTGQQLPDLDHQAAMEAAIARATRRLTKRHIKRFAKHEAGHAVHHVVALSYPFVFVWVNRTNDEPVPNFVARTQPHDDIGGEVFSQAAEICENTSNLVQNCVAGLAGERISRKKPGKFDIVSILRGCEGDFRVAQSYIRDHNRRRLGRFLIDDEDKFMDTCLVSAWNTLQVHKAAHAEVTRLLIERGTLTYEEVHGIVWKKVHDKAEQL